VYGGYWQKITTHMLRHTFSHCTAINLSP
jgi:hypothetical protein